MIEYNGHRYYAVAGTDKCSHVLPKRAISVWYQRTTTGGPTIYLMHQKRGRVEHSFAAQSFGWIREGECLEISLPAMAEWCIFVPASDTVSKRLTEKANIRTPTAWVRFQQSKKEHWKTPWVLGATPSTLEHKEEPMSNFDPFEEQRRQQSAQPALRNTQGKFVSMKDRCGSAVDTIVANNKTAVKAAAFQEVGRIANNTAAKVLAKHLPLMARGYADTPIGKLLIANLALTAQQHFKPNDQTLAKVTSAMGAQAYAEILKSFDIEGFINSVLSDKALQNALTAASDD